MQNKKIFVLFVEPMLYGLDLVREVYEKSGFTMQYYYCNVGLTGKDSLTLPNGAVVGKGNKKQRKAQLHAILAAFKPDFCVINGYTGIDQTIAIRYCIKHKIPYGLDSDTPLHIPSNPIVAWAKKRYLHTLFKHDFCYGIPGGTLQQENFEYYGIPEERNFIRPMSVSADRILSVYNDLSSKEKLKEKYGIAGKKTFLFVGRLEEVKSVDLLIDTFAEIKKKEDIALLIVGDGSLKEQLEAQAKSLGVSDIHFEGYQVFPTLIDYYKAADVFVLPSQFEPWGLVVNEAMTCGMPVILSSKVGCRLDLVEEGENGFIFESGNKEALVETMQKILQADLNVMGEKSKRKMQTWNFGVYLPKFQAKMEEICNKNP